MMIFPSEKMPRARRTSRPPGRGRGHRLRDGLDPGPRVRRQSADSGAAPVALSPADAAGCRPRRRPGRLHSPPTPDAVPHAVTHLPPMISRPFASPVWPDLGPSGRAEGVLLKNRRAATGQSGTERAGHAHGSVRPRSSIESRLLGSPQGCGVHMPMRLVGQGCTCWRLLRRCSSASIRSARSRAR